MIYFTPSHLSVGGADILSLLTGPVGLGFIFDQGCPDGPLSAADPVAPLPPSGPVWLDAMGNPGRPLLPGLLSLLVPFCFVL